MSAFSPPFWLVPLTFAPVQVCLRDILAVSSPAYVYALVAGRRTYIGATVSPLRRLAQHNKILQGGARCTTLRPTAEPWHFALLCPVPSWSDALAIEWHWKRAKRVGNSARD